MSWEIDRVEAESNITFSVGHLFSKYVGFPITDELIEAVKARNPKIFEILEMVIEHREAIFDAHDLEGGDWFHSNYGRYSRLGIEEENQLRFKMERILECESPLIGPRERGLAQHGLNQLEARIEARYQAEAKKYYTAQRRKQFQKDRNSLMLAVIKRDGYHCNECGGADNLSLDHIYPLSKGGSDDLENLQILCRKHNSIKRDQIPAEIEGDGINE